MPLVPLETALFPPDLLQVPPCDASACWWVIHTRPRAEKALARHLLGRNHSFYLPFHRRQWRSRGRLLTSQLPLFPGYLFLHGDFQARQHALETNLAALILPVPDQIQLLDDLRRVENLISAGAHLTPEERLEPGDAVAIIAGPLSGMTGTIMRRNKQLRFLVEIEFLRRGVSVEVESWMIQPLSRTNSLLVSGNASEI
jgi:transcription antitermination factor NusG